MKTYKAEFDLENVQFYIELFGTWKDCFNTATLLGKRLGADFTGILEEIINQT